MNYYLGIELKGSQLKIAAFKKSGSMFELVKLDRLNLPSDINGGIKELTSWINRNLQDQTSIKAVLTISETKLYIKELEFPKMDNAKLNEAVYWEIPSVAPIQQSEAVFDWQVTSENKAKSNVLVIVGRSNYVQDIITTLRGAQIDVELIEPSSYSFVRIANSQFKTNTLLCIADQEGIDFVILKNGIPSFTTSTNGNIQGQKTMRIKSGIDLISEIATEGKKTISYWENKESLKIHQVILGGDLVYKFINPSTQLDTFLPLPCTTAVYRRNKFFKTGEHSNSELSSYIVSLGAASKHLYKNVLEGINLFPQEEKQKTTAIEKQKKAISQIMTYFYANVVIVVLLVSTILTLSIWKYSLEKQLNMLSNSISIQFGATVVDDIKNTNYTIDSVVSLLKLQEDFGAKLKSISDLTPNTVALTSINLDNNKSQEWTIQGTGDRDSILAYYNKINQGAKASEITMPYSNFNKNSSDNVFSIQIKW